MTEGTSVMIRFSTGLGATAMALALAATGQAWAQPAQGVTVFPAAGYADAAPANAWEMLSRTPGFTVVEADADVRGYAGAQGNVLIDGARPASKRDSVSSLLKRIPAGSVDRIELIRGGAPGVDMAGFPIVANIVRRKVTTSERAVEVGVLAGTDGSGAVSGQVEYARHWDDRSLELAIGLAPELDDDSGIGAIRTFDPGAATASERERWDTLTLVNSAEASLAWRQPLAGGRLTLTGAGRGEQTRVDTSVAAERIAEREDYAEAEVGGRFERKWGGTSLDLLASQRLGRLEGLETSRDGADSERFEEATDTGETIVRLDLAHALSDRLELNGALEGAFNWLESEARLEENGGAVPLPGSSVRIEERRGELGLGAVWKPLDGLSLEAGLRVETSTIAQTGDSPLEREFLYAKPRLAAAWDAGASTQLRLSLSREVGQLDFGDFVASASLDGGVVTAGNARLAPDQSWRLTAAVEQKLWKDGVVTLTWTHDEIDDVIDRVLIVTPTDAFDAPGNIGTGRRDTWTLEAASPLDAIGIAGGRLKTSLLWRRSEVTDPVTGQARPISEEKPFEGAVEFTQELPAWRARWGITVEHIGERKTRYRFDQIVRESEAVGWTVFAEQRLGQHWRLRAEATDLFGRDFKEVRSKYDGPRGTGVVEEVERRDRVSPGYVIVSLRRTF